MNQEIFMQDLQSIYDVLQERQSELNSYYGVLEGKEHEGANSILKSFFSLIGLEESKENTLAVLTRIVNLREDALVQVLQKEGFSEEEIEEKLEIAYGYVSRLHIFRHEQFIAWVENKGLLTPFYRALIVGMHYMGVYLTEWQMAWTKHIINGVNKELKAYLGSDAKVMAYLEEHDLLDKDVNGNIADRCYSALVKDDRGNYESKAYIEAFSEETGAVVTALNRLLERIDPYDDEVFNQKEQWKAYFRALVEAFSQVDTSKTVAKWAEVDRAWMAITTPLQIGHPLEYYEDHYRKAVALEWDLRIVNPKLQEGSTTQENIKSFASSMAQAFGSEAVAVVENNLTQVDQTQLYIGQPVLYYGAEFNGLFSAQVVPNDEGVSRELGKKIFAYADFVLQGKQAKPIMRLSVESMGKKFVQKQQALMEQSASLWHKVYDISTIGHEYGHILWIDANTEAIMNKNGQFKNIEEFKATAGGLMAFFANEDETLKERIVDDLVSRAVGLMAWREVGEVLPYYCEGLIHLEILFSSGVMRYEDEVVIDYSKYEAMKEGYIEVYKSLAKHYLAKSEAGDFLAQFAVLKGEHYLPTNENIERFVEHYYARYKEIGQEVYEGEL